MPDSDSILLLRPTEMFAGAQIGNRCLPDAAHANVDRF